MFLFLKLFKLHEHDSPLHSLSLNLARYLQKATQKAGLLEINNLNLLQEKICIKIEQKSQNHKVT